METTFIRQARRAQLVDTAIEVLADVGYDAASMARIAERAGVSRGVLNYHWGSRRELFAAVVEHVYALGRAEMSDAVDAATTPRAALRAFVVGSVHFYARHPKPMLALVVLDASRQPGGLQRMDRVDDATETEAVQDLLRRGRRTGDFRRFDSPVMARTVRAVLDLALSLVLAGTPADQVADEVWATVDAATRIQPRRPSC